MRRMMIGELADWLRSRTNKHKRPFQEDTIPAYCDAAVALDAWMTSAELDAEECPATCSRIEAGPAPGEASAFH